MKKTVLLSLGAVIGLGLAIYGGTNADAANLELFRLYNPNTSEHFYTESAEERDWLDDQGWIPEDGGWATPTEGDIVYRLYNPNASDHHYTTDEGEYANLKAEGWIQEGKAFFSSTDKSVPVYRSYNPNAVSGAHMFTTSSIEHDWLTTDQGWTNEAVSFYAAPAIDKAALNTALTDARALNAADYDETTFAALQEAITAAAAVADNADATQLQVNAQVTALNEAVAALVPNLIDLNAAIEAAGNYDEADITADSYADLEEAVKAAEDFVKDAAGKTPAEAQEVLADLNAALAGLAANTSALNEIITEADEVSTDGYSEESVATFNEALATANAITADSSVEEVTAARTGLRAAIDGLSVDMTALSAAIEVATAFDADDITEASYAAMATALETANGYVNEPAGVTPTQVAEAITALEEAATGLVKDTTAITAVLSAAADIIDETGWYADASYYAFQSANEIARSLNLETATISEITNARINLQTAIDGLVSFEELDDLVNETIQNYPKNTYSTKTYAILKLALDNVTNDSYGLFGNPNATKEDVANAIEAINEAIKGLKLNVQSLVDSIAKIEGSEEVVALNPLDITSSSYSGLATPLRKAKAIVSNPENYIYADVTEASKNLDDAIAALIVDYTNLDDAITAGEKIVNTDKDKYQAASVTEVSEKLSAAKLVTSSGTIVETTAARTELQAALDTAVTNPSYLQTTIDSAKTNSKYELDVTADSYKALTDAILVAEGYITSPEGVTVDQIDVAKKAMDDAVTNLVLSKDSLQALYSEAAGLKEADYTTESWTNSKIVAMTEAARVEYNNSSTSTISSVNTARTDLQTAIDALIANIPA